MAETDPRLQRRQNLVRRLIQRLESFEEFLARLEHGRQFDRNLFWEIRNSTAPQSYWAKEVGVSQGTIGNWERGVTYPAPFYRERLLIASKGIFERQRQQITELSGDLGLGLQLDLFDTQKRLNNSILNAALTDFEFDASTGQIVPVPFTSDDRIQSVEELEEDKRNLLDSLKEQSEIIIAGVSRGANAETDRFVEYFEKYGKFAASEKPNPRLLHRIGEVIARRTATDDVRGAISGWDEEALDGFNSDHIELMRLYFRAALAKAQEVEAMPITDDIDEDHDPAENFYQAAELLDHVEAEDGRKVFDPDVSTLLRDIGNEVRNLKEAEVFTVDDNRKAILRRRRLLAVKNGSIYIGRVLFFASLFVVMNPAALGALGSVASILGILDVLAPGSIRGIYERLRESFPILPRLPQKNGD